MSLAVVTGASGLVGGNLAALLLDEGVRVRATKRAGSRIEHLAHLAIEWVDATLDAGALTRAFTGADVVFHCAAIPTQTRRASGPHRDANVKGTQAVIDAVRAAQVKRLVHTSSVVTCAIAARGTPDVTEEAPWNFAAHGLGDDVYALTKREAELLVLDAVKRGDIDAVVVNPGLMFGPLDAKPSSARMLIALATGQIFAATSGFTNVVDVRDVCRGMIAAWRRGKAGERYILGGDNLNYEALFAIIADELGRKPPRLTLPDAIVRLGGRLGDVGERVLGKEMDLNSAVSAYAVCEGYRFSSEKAKRELGYTLSPIRTAIRDAIAWQRSQGKLS
jgi:dihydroflavonol-4-reductase